MLIVSCFVLETCIKVLSVSKHCWLTLELLVEKMWPSHEDSVSSMTVDFRSSFFKRKEYLNFFLNLFKF